MSGSENKRKTTLKQFRNLTLTELKKCLTVIRVTSFFVEETLYKRNRGGLKSFSFFLCLQLTNMFSGPNIKNEFVLCLKNKSVNSVYVYESKKLIFQRINVEMEVFCIIKDI